MDKLIILTMFLFKSFFGISTVTDPPSKFYDLTNWKLQAPGPIEIKDLTGYSSGNFYLATDKSICFDLDAADKGTTKNAHYVRSELRHLLNWETNTAHSLTSSTKVTTGLLKYQVTVMQIHGINADKSDAPPLLRVALINGDLYAWVKADATGDKTEKKLLMPGMYDKYFTTTINMKNDVLTILVNGKECFQKELPYWNYLNYFKLGCYPQEKEGKFKVYVKDISVS